MDISDILEGAAHASNDCILLVKTGSGGSACQGHEIVWANPRFEELTGFRIQDCIGSEIGFLRGSRTPRRVFDRLLASLHGFCQTRIELSMSRRSGGEIWVDLSTRPFRRDDAGNSWSYLVFQDITYLAGREAALDRAEAERDSMERRFDDITSISGEWIWEQNELGELTYISRSFSSLFPEYDTIFLGKTRHQLINAGYIDRKSADWSFLEERIACREPFSDFLYSGVAQDSRQVWIRISGTPFYDASGVFRGYRGVGSDVTEIVAARVAAEEASRAKSAFLATMSHEIRTPMNGIMSVAEMLKSSATHADIAHYASIIHESSETLLSILNDILDISKIESGKLEIEAIDFSPVDIIGKLQSIYSIQAREKGLEFHARSEVPFGKLYLGDPHRILQILHNLTSNAMKFTEKGSVQVALDELAGQGLLMSVSDTGIGMSESQLARIFQPFTQADSSTTRKFGGTGLGMTIVHKLVTLMGGEIDARSAEGRGTHIRIFLPCLSKADRFHRLISEHSVESSPSSRTSPPEPQRAPPSRTPGPYGAAIFHPGIREIGQAGAGQAAQGLTSPPSGKPGRALPRSDEQPDEQSGERSDNRSGKQSGERLGRLLEVGRTGPNDHDHGRGKRIQESAGGSEDDMQLDRAQSGAAVPVVLVVDDSKTNRMVLKAQLETAGMTVCLAESGERALEILRGREDFACLLLDISMPGMNGVETLHEIRTHEASRGLVETPAVAVTANVMQEQIDHYLSEGFSDHIEKPVRTNALQDVLARVAGIGPLAVHPEDGKACA